MNKFILDQQGKVRSGWRVLFFLFAFAFVRIAGHDPIRFLISVLGNDEATQTSLTYLATGIYLAAGALIIGWLCGWLFEGLRSFRTTGAGFSRRWFRHFLLGSMLGVLSLGIAAIVVFVAGGEIFEMNPTATLNGIVFSLAVSFAVFAAMSAWEEAVFRGYILQTLDRSGWAWLAIVITSFFFGAVHLGNPNASYISTLNTMLAGVWFGMAYLKTRDLWFVWGMHLMWNWTQGSVFGIEVSGLTDITPHPFLREIDNGPTWLTGSTYGLEGGIACTIAIVISMVAIHFLPIRSSHIETSNT